jgi:hypothetical protein
MLRRIAIILSACVALGVIAWLSTDAMAGSVQNRSLLCTGLNGARHWLKV